MVTMRRYCRTTTPLACMRRQLFMQLSWYVLGKQGAASTWNATDPAADLRNGHMHIYVAGCQHHKHPKKHQAVCRKCKPLAVDSACPCAAKCCTPMRCVCPVPCCQANTALLASSKLCRVRSPIRFTQPPTQQHNCHLTSPPIPPAAHPPTSQDNCICAKGQGAKSTQESQCTEQPTAPRSFPCLALVSWDQLPGTSRHSCSDRPALLT